MYMIYILREVKGGSKLTSYFVSERRGGLGEGLDTHLPHTISQRTLRKLNRSVHVYEMKSGM